MSRRRFTATPFLVLAGAVLFGGWFLQEGVRRDENVYLQARVFQEVVELVADRYVDPVERSVLYESAIEGVLERLGDPNSSFIPARAYDDFRIRSTEGEYGGVGLEVVGREGWVMVVGVIPGTPGERAGVRPGDRFVEIDGRPAEGLDIDLAVDLLRGEPGSEVDVRMGRTGVDQPIPFTLAREVIRLRAVPFALRLEGDVGYVPLRIFRSSATQEVRAALDSLLAAGVRSVILDLRGNPGGLLEEGIRISELFLPEGAAIVETRGRAAGETRSFSSERAPSFPEVPLVVLVDGTSASASEIVAGALQDHDRGLVLGQTSYGKGSVQSLSPVTGGNVLRLTTARWYTPVGRSIDRAQDGESPRVHTELSLSGMGLSQEENDERPAFESMSGRPLFGGGGIVPDITVGTVTLRVDEARAVESLYRHGGEFNTALFSFVVDLLQSRPDLAPGFEIDRELLDAFGDHLDTRGVEIEDAVYRGAERYVRYHLEREIALQAFGEAGQFERLRPYDPPLRRALEVLAEVDSTAQLLGLTTAESPATSGSR